MEEVKKNNIYLSLDNARSEIEKRWGDEKLKKKIESVLIGKGGMIKVFLNCKPQSVIWRSMLSPDNGFDFYYQSSNYLGCGVAPMEYLDDKFVTINEEKKALSKIRLNLENNKKGYVELVEYNNQEGKSLQDIVLKNGGRLHEFHQNLFRRNYDNLIITDISQWCKNIGNAKDYYYYYLLHFICHGVLFECFSLEIDSEDVFTNEVIIPAIERIENDFGIKPLIVRLYPENQTKDEDFYWFSYPKSINDDIVNFAYNQKYLIKEYK
jgi:hypothetical protein